MGKSGQATFDLLLSLGYDRSQILTYDQSPTVKEFCDASAVSEIKTFAPKTLFVSPGIALKQDWIEGFAKQGVMISSELNLALQCLTTEKKICITGSAGKSTVVALTEAIINGSSLRSKAVGNFGYPIATYAREALQNPDCKVDYLVVELSSYQLENARNLSCDWAMITSLLPNHLERYSCIEEYYATKLQLLTMATRGCILNENGGDLSAHHEIIQKLVSGTAPSEVAQKTFWTTGATELKSYSKSPRLLGAHNQDNLAMCIRLAHELGLPDSAIQKGFEFQGLPHRLENLGFVGSTLFVNDSKATTIESVLIAARATANDSQKSTLVLLGGRDKHLPWAELSQLKNHAGLSFIFFGECAKTAEKCSGLSGKSFSSLKEALEELRSSYAKYDIILLSPGGSSFDEFKNFEERGSYFISWMQSL